MLSAPVPPSPLWVHWKPKSKMRGKEQGSRKASHEASSPYSKTLNFRKGKPRFLSSLFRYFCGDDDLYVLCHVKRVWQFYAFAFWKLMPTHVIKGWSDRFVGPCIVWKWVDMKGPLAQNRQRLRQRWRSSSRSTSACELFALFWAHHHHHSSV